MITFSALWANHPNIPFQTSPCVDKKGDVVKGLENQCAMRMGICLEAAGMDTSGYPGRRCNTEYLALRHHKPGHILSAQSLADWLKLKLGPSRFTRFIKPEPFKQLRKFTNPEPQPGKRGTNPAGCSHPAIRQGTTGEQLARCRKTGIVFFKDFYGQGGDHIDLWNGVRAISDYSNYPMSSEIWFWEIK